MASKWKKRLKKIGKVAALGALAYGASKLAKGKGKQIPYKNVHKLGVVQDTPHNTLKHWTPGLNKPQHIPKIKKFDWGNDPKRHQYGLKGVGIAKRGMGAAFNKGGHVKSMGIAKRGGGIAKR